MLNETPSRIQPVNLKALAMVYAVVPVGLALVLVDHFLMRRHLLWWMPVQPESWTLWVMLFGMPHVIGSLLGFADRDYLRSYGVGRVVGFAALILAGTVAMHMANQRLLFAVYLVSIVHHTIAQQFGIALTVLRTRPNRMWRLWKWASVVSGGVLYFLLYTEPVVYLNSRWAPAAEAQRLHQMLSYGYLAYGVALVAGIVVSVQAMRQQKPSVAGAIYMIGTLSMGGVLLVFVDLGYYAFAIITGRIVHEMSAWFVYLRHDANRQASSGANFVYSALQFTRLPVPVLSLLVSYGVGMTAGWWYAAGNVQILNVSIIYFSLLHYHMEALIWKRGSMHRQHLQFAT